MGKFILSVLTTVLCAYFFVKIWFFDAKPNQYNDLPYHWAMYVPVKVENDYATMERDFLYEGKDTFDLYFGADEERIKQKIKGRLGKQTYFLVDSTYNRIVNVYHSEEEILKVFNELNEAFFR